MSFYGGHWYPCFGFLVTSPLGFKVRVGSALFAFCRGECNVHSPRSTSGAILADLKFVSVRNTIYTVRDNTHYSCNHVSNFKETMV